MTGSAGTAMDVVFEVASASPKGGVGRGKGLAILPDSTLADCFFSVFFLSLFRVDFWSRFQCHLGPFLAPGWALFFEYFHTDFLITF